MASEAHILVADVGGTHSRFARCSVDGDALQLCKVVVCPTEDLHSTEEALVQAHATGLTVHDADAMVLAVAGPVQEGVRARITNASLVLDIADLPLVRKGRGVLVNDFAAQAWATLAPPGLDAVDILPGDTTTTATSQGSGVRAVLGAGTGLGMASLVPLPTTCAHGTAPFRWHCLSSEGGHAALPLYGRQEEALRDFLLASVDSSFVSAEHVLSGRGLCLVHHFLTGKDWPVERVSAEGLTPASPTLRLYARLYGRVCRHWALQTLSTGGVFVTGGLAVKNPQLIRCADFAEEFCNCPPMGSVLRSIPVRLMTMAHAGLWGAARAAAELLRR